MYEYFKAGRKVIRGWLRHPTTPAHVWRAFLSVILHTFNRESTGFVVTFLIVYPILTITSVILVLGDFDIPAGFLSALVTTSAVFWGAYTFATRHERTHAFNPTSRPYQRD